jgi:hypothetical protein
MVTLELSECCNAAVRWLDCAACHDAGQVCDVLVCVECGKDA